MMVEAGGTEKSLRATTRTAPRRSTEEVIAGGLEASRQWIKESIDLQRELVAAVVATHGPIMPMTYTPQLDYTPDVFDAVAGHRRATASPRP